MKQQTLDLILKHIPKESLTEDVLDDLGVDTSVRGYYYIQRCFIDDEQGVLERAVSDHFKEIYENGKLPSHLRELPCDEQEKLIATLWQWLCTNCGFCELETAFRKGGYDLYRRKSE